MLEFVVDKDFEKLTVGRYLRTYCSVSARTLAKLKREEGAILLNGNPARAVDPASKGDKISILVPQNNSEGVVPVELPIDVVYEDEYLIVLNKPPFMPVHPTKVHQEDTLANALCFYAQSRGEQYAFHAVNRLDRNTSGLVIIGKTAKGLRAVNEKISEGKIRKFYLLRAEGEISPKQGEIKGYIRKNEQENKVYFCSPDADGAKEAVTLYRVLGDGFVEAELITGRTHQIRASFAKIGHPLVGDVKYGAKKNNKNSFQDLISYKIHFDFEADGTVIDNLAGKTIELPIKKG